MTDSALMSSQQPAFQKRRYKMSQLHIQVANDKMFVASGGQSAVACPVICSHRSAEQHTVLNKPCQTLTRGVGKDAKPYTPRASRVSFDLYPISGPWWLTWSSIHSTLCFARSFAETPVIPREIQAFLQSPRVNMFELFNNSMDFVITNFEVLLFHLSFTNFSLIPAIHQIL